MEAIARRLQPYGPLLYHGKVPHSQRQPILDLFKSDPKKHVLLMSYGTGSVGLNLQFTNYVFLFDRWWNPAIEDQAINRAHRLGQTGAVFVSRFISQGTIEERIAEVLELNRASVRMSAPVPIAAHGDWPHPRIHTLNRCGRLEVIDGIVSVRKRQR